MLVCGGCRRHVRDRDARCPFCATPLRTVTAPLAVTVVSMILACGPTLGSSAEEGSAGSTTSDQESDGGDVSTGSPNTTDDVPDPSTSTSIGGSTDEGDDLDSSSDSGAGFIYGGPDTGSPPDECDLFAQDCPDGEKCAPWANDGGPVYNATRCSVIEDQPDAVGEACEYEVSYLTGLDSCDQGAVCLPSTIDASERACVALCVGDADNPYCENPDTTCVAPYGESAGLCLPVCDPLQPEGCAPGQSCTPFGDDWACIVTQGLQPGDACEATNACATGAICLPGDELDTCDSGSCCTSLCDLGEPDPNASCVGSEECQPYYEGAPFGWENLGVCRLP